MIDFSRVSLGVGVYVFSDRVLFVAVAHSSTPVLC